MKKKYNNEQKCEDDDLEEDVDLGAFFSLLTPSSRQKDVLSENGVIFLTGVLTEKSTELLLRRLWTYHFAADYTDPINLIISTPGGYADCMWAVIDTMAAIKNEVHTIAMGEIASAGVMIFVAGDVRKISENTMSMIHNFHTGTEGSYPALLATRKGHDIENKKFIRHFLRHSKYTTEAEVKEYILKDQDYWLSPKELKQHGLADQIFKNKRKKKR